MAAGSRTLKLSILADIDDLKKNLNAGQGEVQGFGDKVSDFGKKAGLAFAAAGAAALAYAGKLAVEGVKAAIEDEAAQVKLANALKASTGATDAQIKSVEAQILKMSLATGTADDKLRPALQRLTLSTNDITKAQDLLSLALDISTSTGKPLEAVANSLGKAYDGNTAALGKLGLGLSAAELKTMNFQQVQDALTKTFGGAAAANAETYAGKIARLQVTFDEAKETLGTKLLPIIEKVVGYVINNVVPALGKFADFFKPITDAISENKETFQKFGQFLLDYIVPVLVVSVGGAFKIIGEIAGGVIDVIGFVIKGLNVLISGAVAGINALISVYNSIPFLPNVSKVKAPTIDVPSIGKVPKIGANATLDSSSFGGFGGGGTGASGSGAGGGSAVNGIQVGGSGTINDITNVPDFSNVGVTGAAVGGQVISYGQKFPTAPAVPDFSSLGMTGAAVGGSVVNFGRTLPDFSNVGVTGAAVGGTVINLNVSGAIDPEGTARTIVDTLNNSLFRGTGGANNLQLAQF